MQSEQQLSGIILEDILPSTRLGTISIDESVPLEVQENCPACDKKLTPFAILRDAANKVSLRVGVCENCGYKGYIDRPSHDWTVSFYANEWDKEFMRSPEDMKKDANMHKGGIKGSRYAAFALHEKIPVQKDKSVLDIGCGYGLVMKNLQDAGFTKIYGVENSGHRADLVQRVFGFAVVTGEFSSPAVEEKLKAHAPYGLMFSHHVLEHVQYPIEIVKSMSRLQGDGDFAIFALPNVDGEHINYVTMYLPHYHGFTKESLELLFNRGGYELVIDDSPNILNTIMAFKKVSNPQPKLPRRNDYLAEALRRTREGLGAQSYSENQEYELTWKQTITEVDTASVVPAANGITWSLRKIIALLKSRVLKRFTGYYVFKVKPQSGNSEGNKPFEIIFNNKVQLLLK